MTSEEIYLTREVHPSRGKAADAHGQVRKKSPTRHKRALLETKSPPNDCLVQRCGGRGLGCDFRSSEQVIRYDGYDDPRTASWRDFCRTCDSLGRRGYDDPRTASRARTLSPWTRGRGYVACMHYRSGRLVIRYRWLRRFFCSGIKPSEALTEFMPKASIEAGASMPVSSVRKVIRYRRL